MTIKVRFLKAHHGDSALITCSSTNSEVRILVDGGPSRTFKKSHPTNPHDGDLKKTLDELIAAKQHIDLVILTHVDDDHINGLIRAFEDENYLPKLAKKVLFNSGELISNYFEAPHHSENEIAGNFQKSNFTGIRQGITLEALLATMNILHKNSVLQNQIHQIEDVKLIFLSPSEKELKKLLGKWEQEKPRTATSRSISDYSNDYQTLLYNDKFYEDSSITNGSSISFILEHNGHRLIFLADAHPSTVIESLEILGYSESNPIEAKLVKLSHHGSQGNTNASLIKIINSKMFVVSTNGAIHGLPDKVTLARIHEIKPDAKILFNYGNLIKKIFNQSEINSLGERLEEITGDMSFD